MTPRFIVHRVHNNNVIHAVDDAGRSVVLTGLGVGYRARRGELVDPEKIEVTYVPATAARADAVADALGSLPQDILAVTQQIVLLVDAQLRLERPGRLLLPLADHLDFAVRRTRTQQVLDIPLAWEVSQLYPRELALGRRAVELARRELQVELPAEEASAFALHFVSAGLSTGVSEAMAMTRTISGIFDVVDRHCCDPVDRSSSAAARFVTHIRYLFVRLVEKRDPEDAPPLVIEALRSGAPRAMDVARDIAEVIRGEWCSELTESEIAYIGLHAYRLLDGP